MSGSDWLVLLLALAPALLGAFCIWMASRSGDQGPQDTPSGLQGLERVLFKE